MMHELLAELTQRQWVLMAALCVSFIAFVFLPLERWLGVDAISAWLRRAVQALERKLNRSKRGTGTRVYRGLVLVLMGAVPLVVVVLALNWITSHTPFGIYIEIWVLAFLLPAGAGLKKARRIGRALAHKKPDQARKLAQSLARRDHATMDDHTVVRVTIEYLTENLADRVIATAVWYLALGLVGAVLVRFVHLLDSEVGHRSKQFLAFGWASAKLDDALQYIPARIAALVLCMAACFVPGGKPIKALRTALSQARKTASPNHGWPIAATAGALGVTLAGPRRLADGLIDDAWIGAGTAKCTRRDLIRALWLYGVSVWVVIFVVAGAIASTA